MYKYKREILCASRANKERDVSINQSLYISINVISGNSLRIEMLSGKETELISTANLQSRHSRLLGLQELGLEEFQHSTYKYKYKQERKKKQVQKKKKKKEKKAKKKYQFSQPSQMEYQVRR